MAVSSPAAAGDGELRARLQPARIVDAVATRNRPPVRRIEVEFRRRPGERVAARQHVAVGLAGRGEVERLELILQRRVFPQRKRHLRPHRHAAAAPKREGLPDDGHDAGEAVAALVAEFRRQFVAREIAAPDEGDDRRRVLVGHDARQRIDRVGQRRDADRVEAHSLVGGVEEQFELAASRLRRARIAAAARSGRGSRSPRYGRFFSSAISVGLYCRSTIVVFVGPGPHSIIREAWPGLGMGYHPAVAVVQPAPRRCGNRSAGGARRVARGRRSPQAPPAPAAAPAWGRASRRLSTVRTVATISSMMTSVTGMRRGLSESVDVELAATAAPTMAIAEPRSCRS